VAPPSRRLWWGRPARTPEGKPNAHRAAEETAALHHHFGATRPRPIRKILRNCLINFFVRQHGQQD
ncbi:MAG: hypothetical protein ACRD3W_00520, partial [Terriglobales bacterium]